MKEPPLLLSIHIPSTKGTFNMEQSPREQSWKHFGGFFRGRLTFRNATFLAPIKGTRISVINGAQ